MQTPGGIPRFDDSLLYQTSYWLIECGPRVWLVGHMEYWPFSCNYVLINKRHRTWIKDWMMVLLTNLFTFFAQRIIFRVVVTHHHIRDYLHQPISRTHSHAILYSLPFIYQITLSSCEWGKAKSHWQELSFIILYLRQFVKANKIIFANHKFTKLWSTAINNRQCHLHPRRLGSVSHYKGTSHQPALDCTLSLRQQWMAV